MRRKIIAILTCITLVLTLVSDFGVQNISQAAVTNVYKLDLSKFNEGDIIDGSKEGLGRSGEATITVTGSDTKSIYISNRKDNWDALDIQNDFLQLDREGTYKITVTGHVDSGVDTKGASAKLGGVTRKEGDSDGYPEFIKEKLEAGKSFTLSYEFKISQLVPDASRNLWVIRVQTDEASGSNAGDLVPFYVDDVQIDQTAAGEPAAVIETSGEIQDIYVMDQDSELKVGEEMASPALKTSGDVIIEVVKGNDGTTSLLFKDRVNNWDGVDILLDTLKIDDKFMNGTYTVEVTGHVEEGADISGTQLLIGMTESPWAELTSRVTPGSDGSFVLSYTKAYTGAELAGLGYGFRVQTPPSVLTSFYIDNITVKVQGATEPDPNEVVITPEWDLTLGSLKDAYADYFLMGNIIEPGQVDNEETTAMFKHHYNVVTAENSMKPENISKEKGQYNYENADKLVEWAKANDIKVHGHTLVWHAQSGAWLNKNSDNTPLTRAEAKANMEEYINNVAGHYAGQVISWDVVNEAFLPGVSTAPANWRDVLRKFETDGNGSPWYQAYDNGADKSKGEDGSDYIYDAFVFTRLADPGAVLYYNDFNDTEAGKREAIAMMVEELNTKWKADERNKEPNRLLIEGIGMQAHYWTGDLKAADVEASILRFIETGAKISVSELDIPFGDYMTYKERIAAPTEEELKLQADLYRQIFEIYKKYAKDIERVTFWGKADSQSWRFEGYPSLFDKNFAAKDAYYAIMEVAADTSIETLGGEEPTAAEDSKFNPQIIWGIVISLIVLGLIALGAFVMRKKKTK